MSFIARYVYTYEEFVFMTETTAVKAGKMLLDETLVNKYASLSVQLFSSYL